MNLTPEQIATIREALKDFDRERLHSHGVPSWVTELGLFAHTILDAEPSPGAESGEAIINSSLDAWDKDWRSESGLVNTVRTICDRLALLSALQAKSDPAKDARELS